MPRFVFFLLLPLLVCTQAAVAAHLPEMQAAVSLQAETPVRGIKTVPARQEATQAVPMLLAAADPTEDAAPRGAAAAASSASPAKPLADAAAGPAANSELSAKPDQTPQKQNPERASSDLSPASAGDTNAAVVADATPSSEMIEKADKKAAEVIISGSRRPGIIEHQLVRINRENKPDINISYPSVGIRAIDANIREWASGIANAFDATFNSPELYPDEPIPVPELWCSYSVSHPSDNALSITFEVWTYAGGSQGNLDIMTLNYSLLTGQRLGLVDIFEDPDAALALMSAWSRKQLIQRLGGMRQEQFLRTGLNPVPENFASLTLIPSGIRINFQPFQVAPGMAGAQKVDIPLEELKVAHPLMLLWGK